LRGADTSRDRLAQHFALHFMSVSLPLQDAANMRPCFLGQIKDSGNVGKPMPLEKEIFPSPWKCNFSILRFCNPDRFLLESAHGQGSIYNDFWHCFEKEGVLIMTMANLPAPQETNCDVCEGLIRKIRQWILLFFHQF
jgi:hypothetical protein